MESWKSCFQALNKSSFVLVLSLVVYLQESSKSIKRRFISPKVQTNNEEEGFHPLPTIFKSIFFSHLKDRYLRGVLLEIGNKDKWQVDRWNILILKLGFNVIGIEISMRSQIERSRYGEPCS